MPSTAEPRNEPPERPVRRRLHPDERRAQLARAARELALEEGLTALTLRGVAARAGVAPALVAHYAPSADALVADAFRTLAAAEQDEVAALCADAEPGTARLRRLIDAIADPARDPVGVCWADAWSLGRRNDELAAAAREVMSDWQSLAAGIVADGVAAGEFADADPVQTGILCFALIDAAGAYRLVDYRTRAERDRLIRDTLARTLGLAPGALG